VHLEKHQRVVLTTQLRALPAENSLFLGNEIPVVGLRGNHVFLVQKVNDPERVNDVAGFDL
jgi:hypothetical protein